jgi:enoyl-CoA hydratase/carnithine racemase
MAPIPLLFSLPIPSTKFSDGKATIPGTITVTTAAPSIYLVSFSSPPDNRLTPPFNSTLQLALFILRHRYSKGVVILTSSIPKFFSNGLDYQAAISSPTFFRESLFPLWHTLLTYPMPIVALINGHAFAGGLMTAMFCDYRVMNPHKGFVCLNELDFGANLRPGMAAIFNTKVSPQTFRSMALESKRFNALAALEAGIVDALGGLEETLKFVEEMRLTEKAKSSSYGTMKESIYREAIRVVESEFQDTKDEKKREEERKTKDEEEKRTVEEWERSSKTSAKL